MQLPTIAHMAQTTVRIDADQYELLRKHSDKTSVPIAAIVRLALAAWFKQQK